MLGSGNPLDALSGLLGGQAPIGLGNGSPVSVAYTPAGEIDSAAIELAGARAGITYMDDGGVAPVHAGGFLGEQSFGEGLGGRSIESVDVDGPLGITADALFGAEPSNNGEGSLDILDGLFTAGGGQNLAPSSLEQVGATGPLGIDLDAIMENGTGSGLTSLVDVLDGDVADASLLDGPGGRIDTLSLQGPVELFWDQSDGGETVFPLILGDNDLIGASLLDNFSNTNTDALEFGILGGETIALDDILGGLFG
jgi:hypothetical protein